MSGLFLTLSRIYLPTATLGVLRCQDRMWFVLEDVGRGDHPDSCVREGEYVLEPHSGPRYSDTYALVGDSVSHQPEPGKARSAVLVHWGNTTADTQGCLLLGRRAALAPQPMVLDSRLAFEDWLAMMKRNPGPHRLRIGG